MEILLDKNKTSLHFCLPVPINQVLTHFQCPLNVVRATVDPENMRGNTVCNAGIHHGWGRKITSCGSKVGGIVFLKTYTLFSSQISPTRWNIMGLKSGSAVFIVARMAVRVNVGLMVQLKQGSPISSAKSQCSGRLSLHPSWRNLYNCSDGQT